MMLIFFILKRFTINFTKNNNNNNHHHQHQRVACLINKLINTLIVALREIHSEYTVLVCFLFFLIMPPLLHPRLRCHGEAGQAAIVSSGCWRCRWGRRNPTWPPRRTARTGSGSAACAARYRSHCCRRERQLFCSELLGRKKRLKRERWKSMEDKLEFFLDHNNNYITF